MTASSGDARATIRWKAPPDPGTYPITGYEVTSSPGEKTCMVTAPALSCDVSGLANGTTYTFTVRALNGAGWGARSLPSKAVTPSAQPSIVITGSRSASSPSSVHVTGSATDLAGEKVVPWLRFPGQGSYTAGYARPTVAADGRFTWTRTTWKKVYVYFRHDDARSNRVIIDAGSPPR